MRKLLPLLFYLLTFYSAVNCFSQSKDSTAKIVFSGYADAYYAFYSDSVGANNYQKFPSVDARSKIFGLNTILVSAQYDADKVRGVFTLHYGDIPNSTWSTVFNNIMEAHVGIKLAKKIWLDAGLFRTHFGTEGLLPKENFSSSVSVCTYYEPYFESGLRLNYTPSDKFSINLFLLNGYNIFEDNNDKKSFGLLATYTIKDNCNIGYSNYIGDDTPYGYSGTHLRIHQNLFLNYQIHDVKIQAGGDYCFQENSKLYDYNKSAYMYSFLLSLKYQAEENLAFYTRGEILNDPDGFMTAIIYKDKGLDIKGITLGIEYKPTADSYIRVEGRRLITDRNQKIFHYEGRNINNRSEILFNIGVSF